MIRFAEEGAAGHLGRFLGSFDGLAAGSVERLQAWATPEDGNPGSSGLAAHLLDASRRWSTAVEGLYHRRTAIQQALPELEHIAGLPAASDEDKRAFRAAKAALKMVGRELLRLQGKYWIAVLEEFGILPNYTRRVTPAGDAGISAWCWTAGPVSLLTRASGEIFAMAQMDTALVIDDRADRLADQDQAAAGWREWLRIANALNLREQPITITAVTEDGGQGVPEQAKHAAVRDAVVVLAPGWQAAHDNGTVAERAVIEEFARLAAAEPVPAPVVGHEEDGLPIGIAWPEAKIAVFLDLADLDPDDKRELELAKWRVFPASDPGAVLTALREAA